MDVKKLIEQVVSKVQNDASIKTLFEKDPIKAIEKVLNIDLPDEVIKSIVDGVKAKLTLDTLGDAANTLKGLFGK